MTYYIISPFALSLLIAENPRLRPCFRIVYITGESIASTLFLSYQCSVRVHVHSLQIVQFFSTIPIISRCLSSLRPWPYDAIQAGCIASSLLSFNCCCQGIRGAARHVQCIILTYPNLKAHFTCHLFIIYSRVDWFLMKLFAMYACCNLHSECFSSLRIE